MALGTCGKPLWALGPQAGPMRGPGWAWRLRGRAGMEDKELSLDPGLPSLLSGFQGCV